MFKINEFKNKKSIKFLETFHKLFSPCLPLKESYSVSDLRLPGVVAATAAAEAAMLNRLLLVVADSQFLFQLGNFVETIFVLHPSVLFRIHQQRIKIVLQV